VVKKTALLTLILFFGLNFGALYIGMFLSGEGAFSGWYQMANKAPWTPPGWVFGAAWTLIMVCFSFYMSVSMLKSKNKKQLISLFSIQWILNISWNPIFFYFHNANLGLAVIVLLTALVGYIFIFNRKKIKYFSFLILPYFLWLVIASSLNGYIVIFN